MNINSVYECSIYQIVNYDIEKGYINYKFKFVKKAIVYKNKNNSFTDLGTKEKYKFGYGACFIGDFFICAEDGMIPLAQVIEHKRKNMTRKKILKKYDEVKDGGKDE